MKASIRKHFRLTGHRLRVTRLALGISEKEAAEAHGVTLATYLKYEAGGYQRGCQPCCRFAKKYRVSLDWLMAGDAGDIKPHLSEEAVGKIAILPVMGSEARRRLATLHLLIDNARFPA